jgi:16S rRNA (adenine1518-N6/adenine1519-N6)-dimethyltransferase
VRPPATASWTGGPARPRQRFGQHFLHDPGVIRRIVQAVAPAPEDRVVEIGPGRGALTVPLLERCGHVEVIEVDRDLAAALAASPAAAAGALRVHTADALKVDFAALATGPASLRVVGNLPYNISTPLLFHLLGFSAVLRDLHLMLQREVVERLAAAPGGRDYGRLSVMIQHRCQVTPLFAVGPGAFTPPPRVDSAVVRLVPLPAPREPVADESLFATLVRRAFSARRKTLRNALLGLVDGPGFAAAEVDPQVRPETLTVEDFARLANVAAGRAREGVRESPPAGPR